MNEDHNESGECAYMSILSNALFTQTLSIYIINLNLNFKLVLNFHNTIFIITFLILFLNYLIIIKLCQK